MRGHLFVFEGPDGVGKTRRCRDTAQFLTELKVKNRIFAFPGKVPGTLGHIVHTIHNQPSSLDLRPIGPAALQTLHIAAQIDVVENEILPLLADGYCILLDRFWWSTWVYGSEAAVRKDILESVVVLEQRVWSGIMPSAAFLIDRAKPIRREQPPEKFARLRGLYQSLAAEEKNKYPVFTIREKEFAGSQDAVQKVVKTFF